MQTHFFEKEAFIRTDAIISCNLMDIQKFHVWEFLNNVQENHFSELLNLAQTLYKLAFIITWAFNLLLLD